MATKKYTIYWIEKHDSAEWLVASVVVAANAKEACQLVKRMVKAETGRNAFTPSAHCPLREEHAIARGLRLDDVKDRALCRPDGFCIRHR